MGRLPLLALFALGGAATLHAQLGAELIRNGSAEGSVSPQDTVADFDFWSRTGAVYCEFYASYPLVYPGGAPSSPVGLRRFSGGSPPAGAQVERTSLAQSIDLSFASAAVDAGRATFDLSAWFNVRNQNPGSALPEDQVALEAQFFGGSANPLGTSTLGPFDGNLYPDPALLNLDVGFFGSLSAAVPAGARSVVVTQRFTRRSGTFLNTGMDLVSFRVDAVPEPSTLAALGLGALALLRRRRAT